MQYRGLTYTDDRPALSRAERRELRARLDLQHTAVVDAVSALGSGAIRLRPDFEGSQPRLTSAHPPLAERCARLARLGERIAVIGGLNT